MGEKEAWNKYGGQLVAGSTVMIFKIGIWFWFRFFKIQNPGSRI
jgi:hypothetical protein